MKLSVKSDYAARAVLELARHESEKSARRVEDLAMRQGIPPNYLVQILIELKAKHLVKSVRGKEGGYLLARPAAEISLGDVLRAIHGQVFESPGLTHPQCPLELQRAWRRLQQAVESAADALNFQALAEQGADKDRMYHI